MGGEDWERKGRKVTRIGPRIALFDNIVQCGRPTFACGMTLSTAFC